MSRIHANNFITTLNGAISDSATSIILTSVTGFPAIGAGVTCNVTLANGADIEIVTATARSSFTLTVTRGAESTVAKAFASGSTVSIRPTADSIDRKQDIVSGVSDTEIGYLDGVTSAIQTQLNLKAPLADPVFTGSLQLPNGAAPTVNVNGEIAIDNTITDHQGMIKYYSTQEMVAIAMPTANLISTDGYVVSYDAATDSFHMVAGGGGGGTPGGSPNEVQYNSAGSFGGITGATTNGTVMTLTSPILVTPALGTPASGVLTNATGLPISTGVSGLGSNVASFLATPSSTNLISAMTDETGTGALVFANTPTLVTPVLGTPTSGTMTNVTGLPLTTGVTGTLPIANGGTAVTSVTTTPTASSFAGWDASSNLTANNMVSGYLTQAAGSTITAASKRYQYFTGAGGYTTTLPVASTMTPGQTYTFVNNSSGTVTVNASGGAAVVVIAAGNWADVVCILASGTSAASWDFKIGTNASSLQFPTSINANRFLVTGGSNNVVTGVGNTGLAVPATNSSATIAMKAGTANQVLNVNSGATDVAFTSTLTNMTFIAPVLGTATGTSFNTITGVASQAEQETGTSVVQVVTPGRQHYHTSAAKAWCLANTNGTIAASYNVSSVGDTGTGVVTINWTTSFSSTNYIVVTGNRWDVGGTTATTYTLNIRDSSWAAGSVVIDCIRLSDGTGQDPSKYCVSAFGDI